MMIRVFLLLSLLCSAPAFAAAAQKWTVVQGSSTIEFKAKQMGAEFTGAITRYTADIAFDPDNLAGSRADITFDIASLSTGAKDRDETAATKDWFDLAAFPTARFAAETFKKTGDNAYLAEGNLTIKNITVPVSLPFTVTFDKSAEGLKRAKVKGSAMLDRSKFSLGTGQWADTSVIANEITVDIDLFAFEAK